MHDVEWAEWVIARFTDTDRAASIVGDLLESQLQRGVLWFWLSFVGIVLSLNRQRLAAFFAACVCLRFLRGLPMPVFAPLVGRPPADQPPEIWQSFFVVLGWVGMLLWVVTPYGLLRYGVRDRLAQLALAFCVPITASIYGWRVPACVATSSVLVLIIFISSLTHARWRKPLLVVVAALIVGYGGIQAAICLGNFYLFRVCTSTSVAWCVNQSLPILGAAILTFTFGRMHQLLQHPARRRNPASKLGQELCDAIPTRQQE
ncbi:MAG TPA: hypothetical protein VGR71_17190 [Nitrospira sp.]|nr:hypothetical protein [Nitrospira sp.]